MEVGGSVCWGVVTGIGAGFCFDDGITFGSDGSELGFYDEFFDGSNDVKHVVSLIYEWIE